MTLEEAIVHAEKVAEENERISLYTPVECIPADLSIEQCQKCAEEHRQLAEWLKELQERRKQPEIIYCGECELKIECCRNIRSGGRKDDDFCSCGRRAERRTDG